MDAPPRSFDLREPGPPLVDALDARARVAWNCPKAAVPPVAARRARRAAESMESGCG